MEKRKIKIGNKNVSFNYDGPLKAKEVVAVETYIKGAHELAQKSIALIDDESSLKHFESIFGEVDAFKQKRISESYSAILEKIENGLKIVRAKQFVSKARKFEPDIFSSADSKDGQTIRIYDAFFKEHEGDDKNLNDRSSVIMHEVAHLVGLTGDGETDSVKSAECLRNFTILVCRIVAPEDLFVSEDESEAVAEEELGDDSNVGADGELPYDPNQPRDKRGRWTAGGGSDGSGGDDNASKKSGTENAKPKDYKLAPGVNAKIGPDGNSIVIGGKITGPNKNDGLEIGNDDGSIRINPDTGIAVQINPDGSALIGSDKPIDVLKKGVKAGSFRQIKIDKDGNIDEKGSQIKGRLPLTGGFILDGLQEALNKNKGKK